MQLLYSIREGRQLVERLLFDLLFRWFVGLGIDEAAFDASTFSKNRDRLLERVPIKWTHLIDKDAAQILKCWSMSDSKKSSNFFKDML